MQTVALAFLLQPINTLADHYWNYFARQNYFDKNGLFITAIFALPALCNIIIGIVRYNDGVGQWVGAHGFEEGITYLMANSISFFSA